MTARLLAGRRAVITGGGRGIGRAIAHQLADLGADVAVLARTRDQVARVAEEIIARGVRGVGIPADVTTYPACQRAIAEAREALGGVEVLVNNAGWTLTTDFLE
jgi:NAD(P)-dependent dehydrogenase (short-subunit alcohol dehydrogenase family)